MNKLPLNPCVNLHKFFFSVSNSKHRYYFICKKKKKKNNRVQLPCRKKLVIC